ncbi:protease HtpX [Candidatus Aerophobetes bacterium]|uniref:Protease HtpX homolog n=1 Tax=Aerophobetes bacterium TaxID=2030807 RepID=A0A2A4YDQ3_UNCAE|nr:MAG: protease HtpX [Candidatus Aerophobetes bacterium]
MMFKRIFLFLLLNILVVSTVSLIINMLHLQPFLRGYGVDYNSLLIFCLIWGMVGAFISLALSRVMAKWMLKVKLIDPNNMQYASLYQMVDRLAKQANLPVTPQVGIFQMDAPNAFATGPSKRRSLVAVSTGILNKLSDKELEAVIGHELAHIKNGDMITMTLLQGVVNAFVMFLARVLAIAISGFGRSKESKSASPLMYYGLVFAFEIVFMILGSMVIALYSRRREFKADQGGAALSSRYNMISALHALDREASLLKKGRTAPSLQAFMIHSNKRSILSSLFSTHPPIEERVKRLQDSFELA